MPFITFNDIEGTKIPSPFERELKILMSPDIHGDVKDFTLLLSTLAPNGGCTDWHGHDSEGELMIFMSGEGKAWLGDDEYAITPGSAMYAPPGLRHRTLNTGSEPLRIACVFVPAVSSDYILANIKKAKEVEG